MGQRHFGLFKFDAVGGSSRPLREVQPQRLLDLLLLQGDGFRSGDEMAADIVLDRSPVDRQLRCNEGRQAAAWAGQQMQRADLAGRRFLHHLRRVVAVGVTAAGARLVVKCQRAVKKKKFCNVRCGSNSSVMVYHP